MSTTERFLEPHQARKRPNTQFEELLGDSIERAFGNGVTELRRCSPTSTWPARPAR